MTYDAYWDIGQQRMQERAERIAALPAIDKKGTPSEFFRSVHTAYDAYSGRGAKLQTALLEQTDRRATKAAQKIIANIPSCIEDAVSKGELIATVIDDDDSEIKAAWKESPQKIKDLVEGHFRCPEAPYFELLEGSRHHSDLFSLFVKGFILFPI